MKKLSILLPVLAALTWTGCTDDCAGTDPPSSLCGIVLVEGSTGLSLIGPDRLYHPDTIMSLTGGAFWIRSEDTVLTLDYGRLQPFEEVVLWLSQNDRDTVAVNWRERDTDCFTVKDLTDFYYNSERIPQTNGGFWVYK